MIISHKYKFIFIKTRKTAGTSLEIALSQFCDKDDILTLLDAEDEKIKKKLGYKPAQNFFAPLNTYTLRDWFILMTRSRYKMLAGPHVPASFIKEFIGTEVWNAYYKFTFERNPFDRAVSRYYWKTKRLGVLPDINEYIQRNTQQQLSNWDKYTINNQIAVNYVGLYERLQDDLQNIIHQAGLPQFTLPHIKKNPRGNQPHYSKLLSNKSKEHIATMCKNEIEAFQYHWEEK